MKLSVILCTHNPKPEYLLRTLDSLRAQTLPHDSWEFLLVDNNSDLPVTGTISLAWHPHGRILQEPVLGLTTARLHGIRESSGEIICFVDDDNILEPDYLEATLAISREKPWIGCWGGEIRGEFEVQPPGWFREFQQMVVVRPLARDIWGNAYRYDDASPCGAGLCVRRGVVDRFLANCRNSPLRLQLGRTGKSLASGEDTDLAFTAIDMGMGTGRFKALQMTHLIPARRVEIGYLVKLQEAMWESAVLLHSLRPETREDLPSRLEGLAWLRFQLKAVGMNPSRRQMMAARERGLAKGRAIMAAIGAGTEQ